MKYIKLFEEIENEPQIGEYAIVQTTSELSRNPDVNKYLSANLGEIYHTAILDGKKKYYVKYYNMPEDIGMFFIRQLKGDFTRYEFEHFSYPFTKEEIIHHAKDPKDLEIYLIANKLNL